MIAAGDGDGHDYGRVGGWRENGWWEREKKKIGKKWWWYIY